MIVYTIGHSTMAIERFLDLLAQQRIDCLVDTRSHPSSRFAPQFNRRALADALTRAGIVYRYLGDRLGGRPPDPRYRLANGKVDYRRLAASATFHEGLQRLLRQAERRRVAIMCSEADYRRCHRYWLIARALVHQGVEVRHILPDGATVASTAEEFPTGVEQLPLF
jgi:uncharacterized protein (DUF488 family)